MTDLASGWTGRTACALQEALHLSNEAFAARLGIGARTVAGWHQKPTLRPQSEMQQILDTTLEQASDAVKTRFAALTADDLPIQSAQQDDGTDDAERRLTSDPSVGSALDWLDQHAGWQPGTARRRVASRMARIDIRDLQDRGHRRGRVNQRQIARALAGYYGHHKTEPYGLYRARYDRHSDVATSILTRPDWLDLDCQLTPPDDRLTVSGMPTTQNLSANETAAARAVQRLAETLTLGVRLIDMPLYQLLSIDVHKREIEGTVGIARFVSYALTMDLLEGELIDALAAGEAISQGALPLRDNYMPTLASVLDLSGRTCAGGTLALCAIARPTSMLRGESDYLLLVQERSGHVVNAAHRLAVIPKGFHQPMADFRADARIGSTLLREMEEELFGRDDIDNTITAQRRADPMHPSRLSEPMRWLFERPDSLRMECTGFGLNLVSGNYEFASLIVIEDDEFWSQYGGQIEANWESSNLRQYSSLDSRMLEELIGDVRWSNEGLFALLQGLRRLGQIGGRRVNLPSIEWEV